MILGAPVAAGRDTKGFTSVSGALQRDVLEQLHPHLTGGPGSVRILFHQNKVRVMTVQGIDRSVRQILRLVRGGLIHLVVNMRRDTVRRS